ncbi:MAG TPA: glycosyltransferase [Tepidisphaeraceae bacterium]|jgi:glycosyltransferase involved in cell wall biosynthesis|nr:glycosyltransferase [Tepidisphaeraceae bacterium]
MRVFMLGWEFPPFISGGLGTACYGLTKALSAIGADIIFVLPRPATTPFSTHAQMVDSPPFFELAPHVPLLPPIQPQPAPPPPPQPAMELRLDEFEHVSFRAVDAQVSDPYQTAQDYQRQYERGEKARRSARSGPAGAAQAVVPPRATAHSPVPTAPFVGLPKTSRPSVPPDPQYAGDLFAEVQRYANLAGDIGRQELFDVVHAHDWMTFPAGMAVAAARGVPLVVHVHSTEFDRSGARTDQRIYDIERRGMHAAMKVIAVSYLTRNQITHHYGVDPSKVEVIHNGIETNGSLFDAEKYKIHKDEKIVLFLGRITQQKGPDYFLSAAKKVLEVMDNVKFVIAGGGDLTRRTIEMASQMGIGHKVLFTGFLRGGDVERVFKMADLYVMPSVSEPFGIAPLEAMSHDVPVLISKQSGASEVLSHVLKVDFWDTAEMANKIIAVLKHPPLASTLRQHGSFEVRQLSWIDAAKACQLVYEEAQSMMEAKK